MLQVIVETIRGLQENGTTGMSMENLYMLVPTANVPANVTVGQYRAVFSRMARDAAEECHFSLFGDLKDA